MRLISYVIFSLFLMSSALIVWAEQSQPPQPQLEQIQAAYDEAAKSQGLEIFNLKARLHLLQGQLTLVRDENNKLKAELIELKKPATAAPETK